MSSIPITTIRPAVHRPTVARPAGKNAGQQNGVAAGVGSTPAPAHIHSVEQINHRQFDDGRGQHDEPRPLLRAKLRAVSHGPTSLHPLTRRGRVSGQSHNVEGGADAESTASGSNVTSISPALSSQGGESDSDLGSAGQFTYPHRSEGNEDETNSVENRLGGKGSQSVSGEGEAQKVNRPQGNVAHIEGRVRHRANDNAQQVYRAGLAAGFSTAAVMQAMLHHYSAEQFSAGLQTLRKTILDDMGSGIHSRNKVLMSAQLFGVRTCVRLGGSLKRCHDLLERFQPSGSNNHIVSVNLLQQVVNCTMQGVNANQVGAISKLLIGDHVHRQVVALNAVYFMFKQQLPLVMWKNENSRYQALQSLEQIMIQHAGIDRANRLSLSMTATGVPR